MEAEFKLVVVEDEWINFKEAHLGISYPFQSYVLGWRMEAPPRTLKLMEMNKMFGHRALRLREEDGWFNFASVVGPEFIPEVSQSHEHLLRIQALVQAEAAKWSLFFDNMPDPYF